MSKQSLSLLSVQQLNAYKQTLNKRIDDLKFFNLDLGRENIRLAEQYRVVRDQANKIKQGKAKKVRRANNFHKNIYLNNQNQHQNNNPNQPSNNIVNKNNFNFNDIYKVSKSKLANWWKGGKKKQQKPQQINIKQNINEQYAQQQYIYQQQQQMYTQNQVNNPHNQIQKEYYQAHLGFPPAVIMSQNVKQTEKDPLQQQVPHIIGLNESFVFPDPVIIKQDWNKEKDPIQQQVSHIIEAVPKLYPYTDEANKQQYFRSLYEYQRRRQDQLSRVPLALDHPDAKVSYQSPGGFTRLYHPQDQQIYIRQQQQLMQQRSRQFNIQRPIHPLANNDQLTGGMTVGSNNESNIGVKLMHKQQNRKATGKNFEFDDLPGMGWRKLKSWVGFGSKNKKEQKKQTNQQMNNNNQQFITSQYQPSYNPNQNYIQKQYPPNYNYQQQHYQQNQQNHQQSYQPQYQPQHFYHQNNYPQSNSSYNNHPNPGSFQYQQQQHIQQQYQGQRYTDEQQMIHKEGNISQMQHQVQLNNNNIQRKRVPIFDSYRNSNSNNKYQNASMNEQGRMIDQKSVREEKIEKQPLTVMAKQQGSKQITQDLSQRHNNAGNIQNKQGKVKFSKVQPSKIQEQSLEVEEKTAKQSQANSKQEIEKEQYNKQALKN